MEKYSICFASGSLIDKNPVLSTCADNVISNPKTGRLVHEKKAFIYKRNDYDRLVPDQPDWVSLFAQTF